MNLALVSLLFADSLTAPSSSKLSSVQILERHVTIFSVDKVLKFVANGTLTVDERVVLHLAAWRASICTDFIGKEFQFLNSGNEVYCTNALLLPRKIMLRRKNSFQIFSVETLFL